ncbi:MAG TPA: hypothetical protein VFE46_14465 [Pirellulales bacterium]|nr:hypothetical protein [Pirellulales bacterium]
MPTALCGHENHRESMATQSSGHGTPSNDYWMEATLGSQRAPTVRLTSLQPCWQYVIRCGGWNFTAFSLIVTALQVGQSKKDLPKLGQALA